MAKICSIENTQKSIKEFRSFDIQTNECSPTYSEILRILKEAFSFVDINQIIKKDRN